MSRGVTSVSDLYKTYIYKLKYRQHNIGTGIFVSATTNTSCKLSYYTAKSKNSALNVNLINFSNNLACHSDYVGYSSIGTTIPERLGHACTSAVLGRKPLAPAQFQLQSVIPECPRGLTGEYVPLHSPRAAAAPARSSTPCRAVRLLESTVYS